MAEILDISRDMEEGKARGDYEHNRRANNRRINETMEQNKWNDIPRSKQDHTPKPARQSFNDELRELSGVPRKGPIQNWERPVQSKKGPWHEHKLDKKQRDEYLAEGKCFRFASGSRSGPPGHHKPPTMSLANIQFKLKEADQLSRVADSSTSFELNNISLELDDEDVDSIPSHSWTPTDAELWLDQHMGDMLDEWWTWRMNAETNWPDALALGGHGGMEGRNPRFSMYCTKGVNFVLFDSLRDEQDEVLVPGNVVQYGDMVSWCRSYLIQTYCIPSVELPPPLGKDLMAMFIEEYLDNGFNNEFDGLAKRFTVSYKSPNVFRVKDRVLWHEFRLPRVMALHPKFRLYNWWLARVQRWEKTQLRTCCWSGWKVGLAGLEGENVGDSITRKTRRRLAGLYLGHVGYKRDKLTAIQPSSEQGQIVSILHQDDVSTSPASEDLHPQTKATMLEDFWAFSDIPLAFEYMDRCLASKGLIVGIKNLDPETLRRPIYVMYVEVGQTQSETLDLLTLVNTAPSLIRRSSEAHLVRIGGVAESGGVTHTLVEIGVIEGIQLTIGEDVESECVCPYVM
ncbi:uncharacterized protein EV420DRAFT_1723989 [Desarmillaria tabescens]|uniref:Uncharacterized protein n=1 Tax=Armillaria tabescens TaxID=1929756 RepID=A0AA39JJN1_ARMTA|nr:uncharacterized protein EV420DRAFT_1723989 [Desarmillaria tabescens]KAK0443427.1 hypothetical protein EV420DRAFT_1723989 [Desarmillaria tabescens]